MPQQTDPRTGLFQGTDRIYQRFLTYLDTLSAEQWQTPSDAAGWTVKDHVIHCAVWAGSLTAVLDKQPRWEAIGIPYDVWQTITENYDQINQTIWQDHRHLSEKEVREAFQQAYQNLKERVWQMSLAELNLPYSHFQELAETQTFPISAYVRGNTGDHFEEHLDYIRKILGDSEN